MAPPPVPEDEKKKIIIGILARNAKTGCQLRQLNGKFNLYFQWKQHCVIFFSTFKIMVTCFFLCLLIVLDEYKELTGKDLTSTRSEAVTLLNSMPEVICENGLYHSASQKSKHIVKFVEEQSIKDTSRRPFRPIYHPYRSNNSFSSGQSFSSGNRPMVS